MPSNVAEWIQVGVLVGMLLHFFVFGLVMLIAPRRSPWASVNSRSRAFAETRFGQSFSRAFGLVLLFAGTFITLQVLGGEVEGITFEPAIDPDIRSQMIKISKGILGSMSIIIGGGIIVMFLVLGTIAFVRPSRLVRSERRNFNLGRKELLRIRVLGAIFLIVGLKVAWDIISDIT